MEAFDIMLSTGGRFVFVLLLVCVMALAGWADAEEGKNRQTVDHYVGYGMLSGICWVLGALLASFIAIELLANCTNHWTPFKLFGIALLACVAYYLTRCGWKKPDMSDTLPWVAVVFGVLFLAGAGIGFYGNNDGISNAYKSGSTESKPMLMVLKGGSETTPLIEETGNGGVRIRYYTGSARNPSDGFKTQEFAEEDVTFIVLHEDDANYDKMPHCVIIQDLFVWYSDYNRGEKLHEIHKNPRCIIYVHSEQDVVIQPATL